MIRKTVSLVAAATLALCAAAPASAITYTFAANLNGPNEPTPSTAFGTAVVTFDDVAFSVVVTELWAGLDGPCHWKPHPLLHCHGRNWNFSGVTGIHGRPGCSDWLLQQHLHLDLDCFRHLAGRYSGRQGLREPAHRAICRWRNSRLPDQHCARSRAGHLRHDAGWLGLGGLGDAPPSKLSLANQKKAAAPAAAFFMQRLLRSFSRQFVSPRLAFRKIQRAGVDAATADHTFNAFRFDGAKRFDVLHARQAA
jgi:hypothetical protein